MPDGYYPMDPSSDPGLKKCDPPAMPYGGFDGMMTYGGYGGQPYYMHHIHYHFHHHFHYYPHPYGYGGYPHMCY
jgi:hypothetical protein